MLHAAPTEAAEALRWIQEAVANGRYITHPHIQKRFVERRISLGAQAGRSGGNGVHYV
jgi:hypothetical protein